MKRTVKFVMGDYRAQCKYCQTRFHEKHDVVTTLVLTYQSTSHKYGKLDSPVKRTATSNTGLGAHTAPTQRATFKPSALEKGLKFVYLWFI